MLIQSILNLYYILASNRNTYPITNHIYIQLYNHETLKILCGTNFQLNLIKKILFFFVADQLQNRRFRGQISETVHHFFNAYMPVV